MGGTYDVSSGAGRRGGPGHLIPIAPGRRGGPGRYYYASGESHVMATVLLRIMLMKILITRTGVYVETRARLSADSVLPERELDCKPTPLVRI